MNNRLWGGIWGLVTGDALGVPYEFSPRQKMKEHPATEMTGHGTYDKPAGTWSDDSSMTVALIDSLIKCEGKVVPEHIMENFARWYQSGEFTPAGDTFDVGKTTRQSIERFLSGTSPEECGGTDERSMGNGSLMRILPLAFYLSSQYGHIKDWWEFENAINPVICKVSALTHKTECCYTACIIYVNIAMELAAGKDFDDAVIFTVNRLKRWFISNDMGESFARFKLLNNIFAIYDTPEEEIDSTGYVVSTLEAALWCLVNTSSYEECVLKAVNLGEDTDSVAAVAGGLAGIYYGYENLPQQWIKQIVRADYIDTLCGDFEKLLQGNGADALIAFIPKIKELTADDVYHWPGFTNLDGMTIVNNNPEYNPVVQEFIDTFNNLNLNNTDYNAVLDKYNVDMTEESYIYKIPGAGEDLILAMISCILKRETLFHGILKASIGRGDFSKILDRLEEIYCG